MHPLRIVFMGTPAFAVPALTALLASRHIVVAVYSQPPRPAGRGQKLMSGPVHALAERSGIPVHVPTSLKTPEAEAEFRSHQADVAVVAAYGLILPETILKIPLHGCLNIHPSALPRWRGAAPIQRTIMAGDTQTALCIMQMDAGLDTGDSVARKEMPILKDMTAGALHDQMAELGGRLMLETLDMLSVKGFLPRTAQALEGITYATKITKEETAIDWNKPALEVLSHIHGLSPVPGAITSLGNTSLKIFSAEIIHGREPAPPGTVLDADFTIACAEGAIRPVLIQQAGGKKMPRETFLRGFSFTPFMKLS